MKATAATGHGVDQKDVDRAEIRQVIGALATSDHSLVERVRCGHCTEKGQTLGEHVTAQQKMAFGSVHDWL